MSPATQTALSHKSRKASSSPTQLVDWTGLICRQLEVSYHVADWQVLTAYPMTSLVPDEGKTRLRWFLRVKQGGSVEDLMTGTESSGLFVEFL